MSLYLLMACIDCDRCNKRFNIAVEPTIECSDAFEAVTKALAAGGILDDHSFSKKPTSMVGHDMLCSKCTELDVKSAPAQPALVDRSLD